MDPQIPKLGAWIGYFVLFPVVLVGRFFNRDWWPEWIQRADDNLTEAGVS